MRFPEGHPVKPDGVPYLVERSPMCGACWEELEFDGDGHVCPKCGTLFANGEEDGPGTLYPEWSGERYADDAGDSPRT